MTSNFFLKLDLIIESEGHLLILTQRFLLIVYADRRQLFRIRFWFNNTSLQIEKLLPQTALLWLFDTLARPIVQEPVKLAFAIVTRYRFFADRGCTLHQRGNQRVLSGAHG